ncbi:MAG: helix-turn-helix domain-containing protein [Deltaproteobacteria bacterium]|nr:helix-turn-helix domain-containing protein [Deltaproteobacteria bacterium]MBI2501567.1 helix-turn-helix domain-containing protein [Deltaproteobacteria bacterium]MBI4196734.1 helix-turn-helix domain-containing protein [Deltaproteobacteria bacterium]
MIESLGQYLKKEREGKGVPLEDLARSTKINLHFLESLEGDQWESLPKGAFILGFLKSYSREVGIPEVEVMRRYEALRPVSRGEEHPFQKFRGVEVRNRFFLFLLIALGLIILAAYLSTR